MRTVSTSAKLAGAQAPAEAPKLKTFRVVIAQSFLHVIDVAAADAQTAEEFAWESYHDDHHRCGDTCGKGEAEVIDAVEVQS
jgi:hypothetical protein